MKRGRKERERERGDRREKEKEREGRGREREERGKEKCVWTNDDLNPTLRMPNHWHMLRSRAISDVQYYDDIIHVMVTVTIPSSIESDCALCPLCWCPSNHVMGTANACDLAAQKLHALFLPTLLLIGISEDEQRSQERRN